MTRANPNASGDKCSTSQRPYTSPWIRDPAAQPPTPLLNPQDAKKQWPLNPFTNPYLWPKLPDDSSEPQSKPIPEWGQIDEEIEFPNRFTVTATDPSIPRSFGCVTYSNPTSPSSPVNVGLFSTHSTPAFPTTYKALAKLFHGHFKLRDHTNATIDATQRQTLLASSPFVTLWRYAADIDKETEKLKLFAQSEYKEALSQWKTGEQQNLPRRKAAKNGRSKSRETLKMRNRKLVTVQEMVEFEETMMNFRRHQKQRHLCIVATDKLGPEALIIDAFQLWDALIHRGLLTKDQVAEEEVKGVFLVWKRVPKESIVRYEPYIEKEDEEGEEQSRGNSQGNAVTETVTKNDLAFYSRCEGNASLILTSRERPKTSVPLIGRQSLRIKPKQPESVLIRSSQQSKVSPGNTPTTKAIRRTVTPENRVKRKLQEADTFAVADVLDHGWGLWAKSGGIYFRHRKGRIYREYLVRWAGGNYEDTWEPEPNLESGCLDYYWKTLGVPRPEAPPVDYDLKAYR